MCQCVCCRLRRFKERSVTEGSPISTQLRLRKTRSWNHAERRSNMFMTSSAHIYPQNNLMLSAAYDTSRERPKQFALDLCVYPLQLPAICRYLSFYYKIAANF